MIEVDAKIKMDDEIHKKYKMEKLIYEGQHLEINILNPFKKLKSLTMTILRIQLQIHFPFPIAIKTKTLIIAMLP